MQHPQLPLPNDSNLDVWTYYELLWIKLIVLYDCLVSILQVLLVDKSLIMNVYKVCNLPILNPVLQKNLLTFCRNEYLVLSPYGNYATLPSK